MYLSDQQNQYIWNFVFILIYVVLLFLAVRSLQLHGIVFPPTVAAFDITLMVLATFRLVRLVSYDIIFSFARDFFWKHSTGVDMETGEKVTMISKFKRGPRRTISELLNCPWCTGIWAALLVVYLYLLTPLAWVPVFVLAVSGVASLLQVLGNLVGHSAEYMKYRSER